MGWVFDTLYSDVHVLSRHHTPMHIVHRRRPVDTRHRSFDAVGAEHAHTQPRPVQGILHPHLI